MARYNTAVSRDVGLPRARGDGSGEYTRAKTRKGQKKEESETVKLKNLTALATIGEEGIPLRYFFYLFADGNAEDKQLASDYVNMEEWLKSSMAIGDFFYYNREIRQLVLEGDADIERVYNEFIRNGYTLRRNLPVLKKRINLEALAGDDFYMRICGLM